MIILGTNSIKAAGGFDVANSCRFNDGSSDYLNKTHSSGGGTTKATYSGWIKKCTLSNQKILFMEYESSGNYMMITFETANTIRIYGENGGAELFYLKTNAVYRDPSAWMHIVVAFDSTQGTASSRIKLYVNGFQETSLSSTTYPSQNANLKFNQSGEIQYIGAYTGSSSFFDGYMSEIVWIDNLALDPTSFGEFDSDSGIWKPIDVSGLTFGTNGFYLDFEDSSALGNDAAGSNNFTVNNLTAIDQSTDTCTNNFATLNPLDNFFAGSTLAEGNCKVTYLSGSGKYGYNTGTIALTSGKWYHEIKIAQSVGSNYNMFGIEEDVCQSAGHEFLSSSTGYVLNGNNGKIIARGTEVTYGNATAVNDIIGVYIDLDNNKLYFAENGTIMNSGTGQTIAAASATKHGYYFVLGGDYSSGTVGIHEFNFGGSPAFTVSSGNTDDNGFGNFEYSPNITGDGAAKKFYAICTKNLAEYG